MGISSFKRAFLILLIIKVCPAQEKCNGYLCKNFKYIPENYFCDGINDCGDYSDETSLKGCDMRKCGPGKFKCDGLCHNISVRCNTRRDCADATDELDCPSDIYKNYKENLVEACFETPDGPICCSGPDSHCQACSSDNLCDQKCVKFGQDERCLCDEHYIRMSSSSTNHSKCWSFEQTENVLIYSTDYQIERVNLFTKKNYTLKNQVNCTALAGVGEFIYYATFDAGIGSIFKETMPFNTPYKIIGLKSEIIGLAVDWITNNVYYSTNISLSVCSYDGVFREVLVFGKTYSIGLAPRFGLMFWILETKDANGIPFRNMMSSSMDGSEQKTFFVEKRKNSESISIMVDELTEKVYAYKTFRGEGALIIFTFNGRITKTISSLKSYPYPSPKAITIFETKIYYTLPVSNEIRVAEKSQFWNSSRIVLNPKAIPIKHFFAYNPLHQHTKISNPCIGACSGLCLLKPSQYRNSLLYNCLIEKSQAFSDKLVAHKYNYKTSQEPSDLYFIIFIIIVCSVVSTLLFLLVLITVRRIIFSKKEHEISYY